MNRQDLFERVLASLQEAALNGALCPSASAPLDEACGVVGNSLYIGEGLGHDARVLFAGLYARGERFQELEREYVELHYPRDERVPHCRTARPFRRQTKRGFPREQLAGDALRKFTSTWILVQQGQHQAHQVRLRVDAVLAKNPLDVQTISRSHAQMLRL